VELNHHVVIHLNGVITWTVKLHSFSREELRKNKIFIGRIDEYDGTLCHRLCLAMPDLASRFVFSHPVITSTPVSCHPVVTL